MSAQSSCARPSLRFVRLNPRFDRDETLGLLKSEIQKHPNDDKAYPLSIPWLNSKEHQLEFFAIPGEFCLHRSDSFQSGRVYGMDVTSGAAVAALLLDLYDLDGDKPIIASTEKKQNGKDSEASPLRVLDLCCAPGLKLCMMADLVPPSSTLVGVDISSQRISLCKNIVKKYHIDESTSGSKLTSTESQIIHVTKSAPPCKDESNTTNNNSTNLRRDKNVSSRVTIRLYCADGTTFGTAKESESTQHGLVFDSNAAIEEFQSRGKRKRMNKSARAREKRRLRELQSNDEDGPATLVRVDSNNDSTTNASEKCVSEDSTINICHKSELVGDDTLSLPSFDRVLVDAECSTDGAIRHIEKRQSSSSSLARSAAWDDTNMDELVDLQKRLIESGFRLLNRGGIMVYSTCSLSAKQNEQVVLWLLEKCKDAFIIPVSFSARNKSMQNVAFIEEGSIPGTVRFNPTKTAENKQSPVDCILPGSGFFLAKIGKRQD